MKIRFYSENDTGLCEADSSGVTFKALGDAAEIFFSVDIKFCEWEHDAYVMMPACVYDGNKIKRVKRSYPPSYSLDETGIDADPIMTDVPALEPDGSGKIQITTGDMATPCLGVFYPRKRQGILIFTEQHIKEKNIGYTFEAGKLTLSFPANRDDLYRHCAPHRSSGDEGISVRQGEILTSRFAIFEFDCRDVTEFYRIYFDKRKSLLSHPRVPLAYSGELWEIMERHFREHNWSGRYFAECSKVWQCGWCGGGMSSYPLLLLGNDMTVRCAEDTYDFLCANQAPSGFYYSIVRDGKRQGDMFGAEGFENSHLIRRSADALYFLMKTIESTAPKDNWVESAKKCADAFVRLYNRYEDLGQFVDVENGDIIIGGTASGAMTPAALAKAWSYFGTESYLDTARAICEAYYRRFIKNGVTNGGAGDILAAPDSESCFALLESYVILYELTREEKWLEYAKDTAHMASSWVVTYKYKFPDGSQFDRLNINTVGSVFANIQNKHSAPGICTLSGDSLYKLYKFTGDQRYLDLILDIVSFIPQCVSTEKRPIYSWNDPPKKLPEGYICERVNMSDWEDFSKIGEVFFGSCWCETSLILVYAELLKYEEFQGS